MEPIEIEYSILTYLILTTDIDEENVTIEDLK